MKILSFLPLLGLLVMATNPAIAKSKNSLNNSKEIAQKQSDQGFFASLFSSDENKKNSSQQVQSSATQNASTSPSYMFDDGAIVTKKKPVAKKIYKKKVKKRPARKNLALNKKRSNKKTKKSKSSDNVSVKQAAVLKSQIQLPKKDKQVSEKKFSGSFKVATETDTNDVNNDDKELGSAFTLSLKYKLTDLYTTGAIVIIDKDLSHGYEQKFSGLDSRVFFSRAAYQLTDDLKLAPSVRFVYPTSNTSKVRDEMIAGIELNPGFGYTITDKWSFNYTPRLRRDFHKYKTNTDNKALAEYRVLQFFSTSYKITDKWSFGPTLLFSKKWSYSGRQQNDSYLTVLDLGYAYSKTVSLGLYTLTGGSYYKTEQGPDESIQFYDSESTTWGIDARLAF